jgi:hypothetical protein
LQTSTVHSLRLRCEYTNVQSGAPSPLWSVNLKHLHVQNSCQQKGYKIECLCNNLHLQSGAIIMQFDQNCKEILQGKPTCRIRKMMPKNHFRGESHQWPETLRLPLSTNYYSKFALKIRFWRPFWLNLAIVSSLVKNVKRLLKFYTELCIYFFWLICKLYN